MKRLHTTLFVTGIPLIMAGTGYLGYSLYRENQNLKGEVSALAETVEISEKSIAELSQNTKSLSDALEAERSKSGFLQEQATSFAAAIQRVTGAVTTLEKRTKTDPELLIKYSKVYFLNEHYTPEKLALLPKEEMQNAEEEYFHARALPHLLNLLKEARTAGAELKIISAFRSFETQRDLKSQYKVVYGSGANKFSAEQGYSEHQLGTTVDFTTNTLGESFGTFDSTPEFQWLTENAHRFGFVLSYPKGNSYYIYEPWHWRFVGIELATRLHSEGTYFYDMDQRDINEYLVKLFD